jgi:hypothetical protein
MAVQGEEDLVGHKDPNRHILHSNNNRTSSSSRFVEYIIQLCFFVVYRV